MIRRFWRRRWRTPSGFFTAFGINGDPAMDAPGVREATYSRVFASVEGRMVLADILARAGIGRPDFEPGAVRDEAIFYSGMKANALQIARTAGLETGALGRALVNGQLEGMTDDEIQTDDDE